MKTSGIVRRMDELGRVVLPIELRRSLDIEERDPIEISMEGDRIILKKYHQSCIFCGCGEDLLDFSGKRVCRTCLKELNQLDD